MRLWRRSVFTARISGTILQGADLAHKEKIRSIIFASGSGTNAENLIRHAAENADFSVAAVICDNTDAGVISKCAALGVPCHVILFEGSKHSHEEKIRKALSAYDADWIFLAGYMRILSAEFITEFYDPAFGCARIVNIHPSLLPAFRGKDAYARAFTKGVSESGVTVHFVDSGIDTGPVILQRSFPRIADDTLGSFTARGMALEYKTYIDAIALLLARLQNKNLQEKRA
ncbi:MAG: phosphoribosylglycinamide formyltransferase [Alphaproteobacteria bacterium]|nr:MAG: phosphoribosylglycinamide formyltransferase [Alphaproteobacteria bacterium]